MSMTSGGVLERHRRPMGMKQAPTPATVRAAAAKLAFGTPIVQNNLRAIVAEVITGYALGPDWHHCSADWSGWDFEHKLGARLEVKQSAARQTWKPPPVRHPPRFDISPRSGYWQDGSRWIERAGRHAQIYVFCHHPVDDAAADHRDPLQWSF
ncbi:MAG: hypothetical protein ACREE2_04250 [Stellaceae bacterium]